MTKPVPFGKYFLLERINVGGMAEVFKAKAYGVEGFEKLFAIKRILPNIAQDEEFIRMFVDEAKIAVQLTHPNIAQTYDLGRIGEAYFIAMEYVDGVDMRAMFETLRERGEVLPLPVALHCLTRVCEGLDYAHRRTDAHGRPLSIVHRDISPQNVLVSLEGDVKLIDFGIAKAAGKASRTQAGFLKGKFSYMSPEQVKGLPVDHRSDLFAFGTVMYEVLTGRRLFLGESDFSTLERVRNVEVVPPSVLLPEFPPDLEAIVMRCLQAEPPARYQAAGEIAAALQRFAALHDALLIRDDLGRYMRGHFARDERTGRRPPRRETPPTGRPPMPAPSARRTAAPPATPPPQPTPHAASPSPAPSSPPPSVAAAARPVPSGEPPPLPRGAPGAGPPPLPGSGPRKPPPLPPGSPPPPASRSSPRAMPPVAASPTALPPSAVTTREIVPPDATEPLPSFGGGSLRARSDPRASRRQGLMVAGAGAAALVVIATLALGVRAWVGGPVEVRIESAPPGAQVTLDGEPQPGRTPLALVVRAGTHLVTLRLDGYQTGLIEFDAARHTAEAGPPRVHAALVPTVRPATLVVRSEPPGAVIVVDGRDHGAAPVEVTGLLADRPHHLVVDHPGHQPHTEHLRFQPGERREVTARLRPFPATVTVVSRPPGAELFVDGVARGRTPATVSGIDAVGRHDLKLLLGGYQPWTGALEMGGQVERTLTVDLEVAAGAAATARGRGGRGARVDSTEAGILRINSRPWAQVWIDGHDTGHVTPLLKLKVSPGSHTVTLRNPAQGCEDHFDVTVEPARTYTWSRTLTCPR